MKAWPWERLGGGRWLSGAGLAVLVALWAWVLASWPLQRAAALLVAAGCGVAILVRPGLGLPLLALAIPFGSLRTVQVGPAAVGAEELLLGAIVVAWLVRQAARRSLRLRWPPFAWAGLGLLAAMLVSFLPASSPMLAVKEMLKWVELWLAGLLVLNVADEGDARLLVGGLLVAGAAQGLLGLYQFVARRGPPEFVLMGRFMRAAGTFDQPNPYGGYLGLTVPLAAGLVLTCWPGVATGPACWSRGAWLGGAAGLGAVVVARGRRWLLGSLVAVAAAAALSLVVWGRLPLPNVLVQRFAEYAADLTTFDVRSVEVTDANYAVVERVAHWQAAWAMFSERPWTGVGLGNYPHVYERYALPRWPEPLGHAHNYYLNIAAEAGLPGLVAYLLWAAAGLWLAARAVRRARGLWLGPALGALGMWFYLAVHSLFDNLYVHGMGIQVGLLLGLAAWIIARGELPASQPWGRLSSRRVESDVAS